MLTFLFWNLNGKDLSDSLVRLVEAYAVDVLILAECLIAPDALCDALNASTWHPPFHHNTHRQSLTSFIRPVEILSRFDNSHFVPASNDNRYTIRYFRPIGREEIILVTAHMKSHFHSKPDERDNGIKNPVSVIRRVEAQTNHQRTLLIGDLNINPFDSVAISATGLHAVMTKAIARRERRTVEGEEYSFFYNPMWRLLGDRKDGPAGSFYYDRGGVHCQFWHLFDQVMIRPSLIDEWNDDSLALITNDGQLEFLRNGKPNSNAASDHLPVLFRLK